MTTRLFGPAAISHGTVVLNCGSGPIRDFGIVAQAFHDAGQDLVEALRQDEGFGPRGGLDDYRAYPIMFMYRHAVELRMKDLILAGSFVIEMRGLTWRGDALLREHRLQVLRSDVEAVIEAHQWGQTWCCPPLEAPERFGTMLDELSQVDDGSFVFRYPVDTKGAPALPGPLRFDLFNACSQLDVLLQALENATNAALGERDHWIEEASELRRLERENYQDD